MVVEAIVMISVDVGKENEIFEQLFTLPEVKEVYMTYGIYDIIAIIETSDLDEMRNLVTGKIRRIDGIKETLTAIVVTFRRKRASTGTEEEAEKKEQEAQQGAEEAK